MPRGPPVLAVCSISTIGLRVDGKGCLSAIRRSSRVAVSDPRRAVAGTTDAFPS